MCTTLHRSSRVLGWATRPAVVFSGFLLGAVAFSIVCATISMPALMWLATVMVMVSLWSLHGPHS